MKYLLLLFICMSTTAIAATGLNMTVYTTKLKYDNKPSKRVNIRTKGDMLNYLDRKIEVLRERLNPMLDRFKEIAKFSNEQGIDLVDFDPNYNATNLDLNKLEEIDKLVFPHNLIFTIKNNLSDDIEHITLSFKSKPSVQQLKNTIFSFEQLFNLNLKPKIEKNVKKLSPQKKEMLEPIKQKAITFMKYQTYYGVRFKNNIWVEAAFFNDLKKKYEEQFAIIQKDFKYYFYRNKNVDLAIKSNLLKNLEKLIEDNEYENLEEPFDKKEIDKNLIRLVKIKDDIEISFLFAKEKGNTSVEPVLKEVLNQIK